ncbi:hypothetical protein [Alishewanella longhuensis]
MYKLFLDDSMMNSSAVIKADANLAMLSNLNCSKFASVYN